MGVEECEVDGCLNEEYGDFGLRRGHERLDEGQCVEGFVVGVGIVEMGRSDGHLGVREGDEDLRQIVELSDVVVGVL